MFGLKDGPHSPTKKNIFVVVSVPAVEGAWAVKEDWKGSGDSRKEKLLGGVCVDGSNREEKTDV